MSKIHYPRFMTGLRAHVAARAKVLVFFLLLLIGAPTVLFIGTTVANADELRRALELEITRLSEIFQQVEQDLAARMQLASELETERQGLEQRLAEDQSKLTSALDKYNAELDIAKRCDKYLEISEPSERSNGEIVYSEIDEIPVGFLAGVWEDIIPGKRTECVKWLDGLDKFFFEHSLNINSLDRSIANTSQNINDNKLLLEKTRAQSKNLREKRRELRGILKELADKLVLLPPCVESPEVPKDPELFIEEYWPTPDYDPAIDKIAPDVTSPVLPNPDEILAPGESSSGLALPDNLNGGNPDQGFHVDALEDDPNKVIEEDLSGEFGPTPGLTLNDQESTQEANEFEPPDPDDLLEDEAATPGTAEFEPPDPDDLLEDEAATPGTTEFEPPDPDDLLEDEAATPGSTTEFEPPDPDDLLEDEAATPGTTEFEPPDPDDLLEDEAVTPGTTEFEPPDPDDLLEEEAATPGTTEFEPPDPDDILETDENTSGSVVIPNLPEFPVAVPVVPEVFEVPTSPQPKQTKPVNNPGMAKLIPDPMIFMTGRRNQTSHCDYDPRLACAKLGPARSQICEAAVAAWVPSCRAMEDRAGRSPEGQCVMECNTYADQAILEDGLRPLISSLIERPDAQSDSAAKIEEKLLALSDEIATLKDQISASVVHIYQHETTGELTEHDGPYFEPSSPLVYVGEYQKTPTKAQQSQLLDLQLLSDEYVEKLREISVSEPEYAEWQSFARDFWFGVDGEPTKLSLFTCTAAQAQTARSACISRCAAKGSGEVCYPFVSAIGLLNQPFSRIYLYPPDHPMRVPGFGR